MHVYHFFEHLYSGLPKLSDRVAARKMKLAGHCHLHRELPASRLVLWEPNDGRRHPGRQTLTYVNVLKKDDSDSDSDSDDFIGPRGQFICSLYHP